MEIAMMYELAQAFLKLLTKAQRLRVSLPLEAWVKYERQTMLKAVNAERLKRSFPPVLDVDRAERAAYGHSDYTQKFALYCAEMVMQL